MTEHEKRLSEVGVKVQYERNWVGEPGKGRHPEPDPTRINRVYLPFKPADWWQLVTRDGEDYIGPCCGTTGAMQDILCGVHRDSGYISDSDLLELGQLGEQHDGTEWWADELTSQKLTARLKEWKTLDRWTKIGVIYQACRAKLRSGILMRANTRTPEAEDGDKNALSTLEYGLRFISYRDLFRNSFEATTPEQVEWEKTRKVQEHVHQQVLLARVIPAARKVVDALLRKAGPPFEGVCIVLTEEHGHVISNGHGLCVYETEKKAQEVIDSQPEEARPKLALRPCRVSVEEGLRFLDEATP
jgi:hypothetical protein